MAIGYFAIFARPIPDREERYKLLTSVKSSRLPFAYIVNVHSQYACRQKTY
jgi:hypothetical protein